MKKFAIGLILASAAFTGTAQAQNFDGLSVEARLGHDRQRLSTPQSADLDDPDVFLGGLDIEGGVRRENGLFYGVGVGYDRQEGPVVVGFQLALDFPQADDLCFQGREGGDNENTFACAEIKNDIEASFRLGFPVTPNFMVYAKAGGSFAQFEASAFDTEDEDDDVDPQSGRELGYLFGAGVEFATGQGFYAKGEYRYIGYGDVDTIADFADGQNQGFDERARYTRNQFMGAVGFRF